jgi:hypothetical protein
VMSGQWQPRWERPGGELDPLRSLREEAYQRENRPSEVHLHECNACEEVIVCTCRDRRQVDRRTGRRRELYCIPCWRIRRGMLDLELEGGA